MLVAGLEPWAVFASLWLALAIDAAIGDPPALYRRIPHPVVWFGRAINFADRRFNRDPDARRNGILALSALAIAGGAAGYAIERVVSETSVRILLIGALTSVFIAQRSLYQHVLAVADALDGGGIEPGRAAVGRIVGRDPASLDEAGIARAAIESCAESLSDGIVAPALWFLVFGLPGLIVFKIVSTADSMIGHLTPKHRSFGWAAARSDDLLNRPTSRLTAGLLVVAALGLGATRFSASFAAVRRDAHHHTSRNAGWPEAAMAGALGVRLAGPRRYDGHVVGGAWMGEGRMSASSADVRASVRLAIAANAIFAGFVAVTAYVLAFAI